MLPILLFGPIQNKIANLSGLQSQVSVFSDALCTLVGTNSTLFFDLLSSREQILSKVKDVQCIFSMPNEVYKYGAECIIKKIYGDFYSDK